MCQYTFGGLHETVFVLPPECNCSAYSTLSSCSWFDTELWINHTLVPHLHQNPSLRLVGLPQLQYTHALGSQAVHLQSNNSGTIPELLTALHTAGRSRKQ